MKTHKNRIAAAAAGMTPLLILAGASVAEAAGTYEIYTYGSGDFVAQVLVGVALMFSGNMIQSLIKVILIVGLLTAIISPITAWLSKGGPVVPTGGEGFIVMLRQVLLAVIAVYIFILPKANVAIIDNIDPAQSQVVSDIPLVQALVAHGSSRIGYVIGREMETAFSLPDEMKFQKGGVGIGIKYIDTIFSIQPPSSSTNTAGTVTAGSMINESLTQFFNQCVFPQVAILDGAGGVKTKALHDMANTINIMNTISNTPLFMDPNITITAPTNLGYATCSEVIPLIGSAWTEIENYWIRDIEMKLMGSSVIDPNGVGTGALTQTILTHYFPEVDPKILLRNIAVGNRLRQGALTYDAIYGEASTAATSMAINTTVAGWQTTARLFGSIVNTMRNVFEGLIYGLSVFLPVVVAVAGLAPLGTYLKVVLWLQLWIPFYVLLNLFADMEMARQLNSLMVYTVEGVKGITVRDWMLVGEKAQLSLGYVGSLAFTVPMFAWGLLKGGEYAMSSAITSMTSGGGAAGIAASVGGQVAGMGNVNMGNRSVDSTSMRRFTTLGSQASFEYQTQGMISGLNTAKRVTGYSGAQLGANAFFNNASGATAKVVSQGGPEGGYQTDLSSYGITGATMAANRATAIAGGYKDEREMAYAFTKMSNQEKTGTINTVATNLGVDRKEAEDRISKVRADQAAIDHFTKAYVQENILKGGNHKEGGEQLGKLGAAEFDAIKGLSQEEYSRMVNTQLQQKFAGTEGELKVIKALGGGTSNTHIRAAAEKIAAYQYGDTAMKEQIVSEIARNEGIPILKVQEQMAGIISRVTANGGMAQQAIGPNGSVTASQVTAGFGKVTNNADVTKSGTSILADNSHKTIDGTSQVTDNSVTEKVGKTFDIGNAMGAALFEKNQEKFSKYSGGSQKWTDPTYGQVFVDNAVQAVYTAGAEKTTGVINTKTGISGGVFAIATQAANSVEGSYTKSDIMKKYKEIYNDKNASYEQKETRMYEFLDKKTNDIAKSIDQSPTQRMFKQVIPR